ncbi:unnamed protein product, partial [marine sediment metagenome]
MAEIEKEPETPYSEFVMAIAGPTASFVMGIIFGVIWILTVNIAPIREPVKYLAIINIVLGVFNMLPGYPLDGGRVLRSIVWRVTGNLERSTFIASTVGNSESLLNRFMVKILLLFSSSSYFLLFTLTDIFLSGLIILLMSVKFS